MFVSSLRLQLRHGRGLNAALLLWSVWLSDKIRQGHRLKMAEIFVGFNPNGMEARAFFAARGLQRHSTQKCKLQPCPDSQVLSSLYWMPHSKIFVSLGNFCSCTPGESPQEVLAFEVWQNGFRTRDMHWKPKTPVCSSHDIDCTCRCGLFLWQTGKKANIGHGTWQPWHLKNGVSSS